MDITDEIIQDLITCRKVIIKPPKARFQNAGSNIRNDFEVSNENGQQHFFVFLRCNTILPDRYSIGLRWRCQELSKDIIIFRCNGPHGGNLKFEHHFRPHIHYITAEDINEREIYKTTQAEITDAYCSFAEAFAYFCCYCGIDTNKATEYFPDLLNVGLFDDIMS